MRRCEDGLAFAFLEFAVEITDASDERTAKRGSHALWPKWASKLGHWMNNLRSVIGSCAGPSSMLARFNASGGAVTPQFDLRRGRVLQLCSAVILLTAIPWAPYLLRKNELWPALLELCLIASAFFILLLEHVKLLRLGSLLLIVTGVLSVCGLALMVDVPSTAVPRTIHLFFIPICIANTFLFQNERHSIRYGTSVLILAIFCFLALSPSNLGMTPFLDEPARHVAAWLNVCFTAFAVFALLLVMLQDAKESDPLETEFARAIIEGDIQAYLQPQCMADGRIVGAEALMRWRHAERGFVSPDDFMPVAERSGLINAAGQRVLEDICKSMLRWQEYEALRDIPISINVSPAQLTSDKVVARLVDAVPPLLLKRGLIKFELSESMFGEALDATGKLLEGLRTTGIPISLDNVGTGVLSLNYPRPLPLDDLKLDQSFVRPLPADRKAEEIARSIVTLGHSLGLSVIAEGVENRSQLDALQRMGCTCFQGFFFGRPVCLHDFERQVLHDAWHRARTGGASRNRTLAPA